VKRWVVIGLLLLPALYLGVYWRYRLPRVELLDRAAADQAIAFLSAAAKGRAAPSLQAPALARPPRGPIWVTLYRHGERVLQHRAEPPDVATALRQAAEAIRARRDLGDPAQLRIKLDLTTAEGPIVTAVPLFFAHSIVPGLDGLGLRAGDRRAELLPDELFARDLLSGEQLFSFMSEFRSGLALHKAIDLLADRLELTSEAWRRTSKRYFRFRVQSFVDDPAGPGALPVLRSRVPVESVDRATVRQAVIRAADYVLRLIRPDGSFEYIYYPLENTYSPREDYSLPRHAGTTWFLSLAYRVTGERRYLEGARRAIDYLGRNAVPHECQNTPYACIGNAAEMGDLGSSALGIVAIAQYQQATGDTRFESLARRLGELLLWMQKPNGDFCHSFTPRTREKNCIEEQLYYSGEAALGLAKLWQLTHDEKLRAPLERALDFLTGENYDFFLGQFFIGEDHWTCIAAEAAFEAVNKAQYADFCYAFARLNARAQVQRGEGLMDDLYGVFAVTPFFSPHNTPAGSRTESNVSTYLLGVKRGEPKADILRSIRLTMRYLVDQQLRPESSYLFRKPELALGGMMQTPQRSHIRIDFVQHAAAAMARGLELVPETRWP
jgi:hypothetical protein